MKSFIYFILIIIVGSIFLQNIYSSEASAQGWKRGLESVSSAKTGLPETDAKGVVINVVRWLLSLVFWLAVLAFVGSGLIFILSFGSSNIHSIAKDWLMFAVIGLVVSVLGYVIIISVSNILIGKGIRGTGGGVRGTIGVDEGGIWGEATIPVGDNGSITVDNGGVFGEFNLRW